MNESIARLHNQLRPTRASITSVIANFGDVIELDLTHWKNIDSTTDTLVSHEQWKHYNPRKPWIKRYGLSVTSLDGGYSGVPDLDSLREYNIENSTKLQELDFRARTDIVNVIPELNMLLDLFPDHGRCHFLRLDAGGFFPPHRDNGLVIEPATFRIIVPVNNFSRMSMVWLQEDRPLYLERGHTYFINTTKCHSLFSFVDNCICFVMNVLVTEKSLNTLLHHSLVK
jgi:hypothetical protein